MIPGYLLARPSPTRKICDRPVHAGLFCGARRALWKGHAQTRAWLVAGGASLLLYTFVPGYWYLIGGALAGITWPRSSRTLMMRLAVRTRAGPGAGGQGAS